MKNKLLYLLLILSCSTTKYYNAADLKRELSKNAEQLRYIEQSVSSDFNRKVSLYESLRPRMRKNRRISKELGLRLKEMENKKSSLLVIGSRIKKANESLLNGVSQRKRISDREPIFKKIEHFGDNTTHEARKLFDAFDEYRTSSARFTKFMLFSGTSLQGKTSENL
jgi:hypothetical protein